MAFFSCMLCAAQLNVDSMIKKLNGTHDKLERAALCLKIADNHPDQNEWIKYNDEAYRLAEGFLASKDHTTQEKANSVFAQALNNKGFIALSESKWVEAYDLIERAIELIEKNGNKSGLAACYTNMGALMDRTGKLQKAIDYYLLALKQQETISESAGKANILNNIGTVYLNLNNNQKAEEYYLKAIEMHKKTGNIPFECIALSNLSSVYRNLKRNDEAFKSAMKALELAKKMNEPELESMALMKVSDAYIKAGKYDSALYCSKRSSELSKMIGNYTNLSNQTAVIGYINMCQKKYREGEPYLLRAYDMADSVHDLYGVKFITGALAALYDSISDYKNALRFYKKYSEIKDTVLSAQNRSTLVKQELQTSFDKKENELKLEQAQQEKEIERQKLIKNGLVIGAILLLILLFLIFRNLVSSRRSEKQLALQKKEVEEKKTIIEEKQQEIISSINYAKRIQSAVLTGNDVWGRISKDHFIIFRPRDIVSGDFYWAHVLPNGRAVFALADCTGHGVPGGFMSMLGNSFLNELVVENKIFSAAAILNKLRDKVIKALDQQGSSDQKDGMDMALCVWNKMDNTLEFAGANNSLYIVREGTLTELAGDKMPIGKFVVEETVFVSQTVQLQKGDGLYLCTDGLPDQFGGPKAKKFKYRQLEELLVNVSTLSPEEQKEKIDQAFLDWKGKQDQMDDVSLIGVRI
jgi:serine phosphatase RsbU (regulator of sigma subunit)